MVVCGDDALAHRLSAELRGVYGEQVTLVVPSAERTVRPPVVGRARASTLLDRMSAAVTRAAGNGNGGVSGGGGGEAWSGRAAGEGPWPERVLEAAHLTLDPAKPG